MSTARQRQRSVIDDIVVVLRNARVLNDAPGQDTTRQYVDSVTSSAVFRDMIASMASPPRREDFDDGRAVPMIVDFVIQYTDVLQQQSSTTATAADDAFRRAHRDVVNAYSVSYTKTFRESVNRFVYSTDDVLRSTLPHIVLVLFMYFQYKSQSPAATKVPPPPVPTAQREGGVRRTIQTWIEESTQYRNNDGGGRVSETVITLESLNDAQSAFHNSVYHYKMFRDGWYTTGLSVTPKQRADTVYQWIQTLNQHYIWINAMVQNLLASRSTIMQRAEVRRKVIAIFGNVSIAFGSLTRPLEVRLHRKGRASPPPPQVVDR